MKMSYALAIVATLLATAFADQCDVADDLRSDCAIRDQGQCESSGCCWKPINIPGKPWCFRPQDECGVPSGQKVDCGLNAPSQQQCEASGCCWRPVAGAPTSGEPWCFKKNGPDPSPPTPPSPTPPSPTPPMPPTGIMKGIGYSPVPMKNAGILPHDDFFCEASKPLWGPGGRNDLKIMQGLGANFVRVYGNDPRYGHTEFLQYARDLGMSAFIGISDWPYHLMPGACAHTGFNCYSMVKDTFKQMLKGLIVPGTNQYHPTIKYIALSNEPDQKYGVINGGHSMEMMISAFDAVIDAEKELGVVAFEGQDPPKFTATFTFAITGTPCGDYGQVPGLGQMTGLHCAMKNPGRFGYTPKNNIGELYESRYVNSFNTENTPSSDGALRYFLNSFKAYFGNKPVFIGEYHRPYGGRTEQDLKDILQWAADPSNPFIGISFFEFEKARFKPNPRQHGFGMFDQGNTKIGEVPLEDNHGNWPNFPVWCLSNVWDPSSNKFVAEAVRSAFGGPGVDPSLLCPQVQQEMVTLTNDSATVIV